MDSPPCRCRQAPLGGPDRPWTRPSGKLSGNNRMSSPRRRQRDDDDGTSIANPSQRLGAEHSGRTVSLVASMMEVRPFWLRRIKTEAQTKVAIGEKENKMQLETTQRLTVCPQSSQITSSQWAGGWRSPACVARRGNMKPTLRDAAKRHDSAH